MTLLYVFLATFRCSKPILPFCYPSLACGCHGLTGSLFLSQEDTSPESIILQEPASVKKEDTEDILSEKIKEAENRAFPIALQLVASGMVQLGADGKTYWKRESQKTIKPEDKQDCSSSYALL